MIATRRSTPLRAAMRDPLVRLLVCAGPLVTPLAILWGNVNRFVGEESVVGLVAVYGHTLLGLCALSIVLRTVRDWAHSTPDQGDPR